MENLFDKTKNVDNNREFWYARDMMIALNYREWRSFNNLILRIKQECLLSEDVINKHFYSYVKKVPINNNAKRNVIDYKLSRYACYLIAKNADIKKPNVRLARKYFQVEKLNDNILQNIKGRGISKLSIIYAIKYQFARILSY